MLIARLRTFVPFVMLLLLSPFVMADVVVLSTGERLIGDVVEQSDGMVTLDHPVLGRIELSPDAVNQVILTDEATPREEQESPAEEDREEETPEEETPAPEVVEEPSWASRIELGFGVSEGNTESKNLNLNFRTERDTKLETTTFDAAYYFAEDDGDTSENKATAGVNQDWKEPDTPWLYFARARYDYDEFNSWQSRVTAGVGVGYRFVDEDDFKLTGRAGLGAAKEFQSDRDDVRLEGILGIDLNWAIDEHQRFVLGSTYFPDLDETGEFRTVTDARWALNLPQYDGASVFLGLRHEHQSLVDPGQENNDLLIFGGLAIDF